MRNENPAAVRQRSPLTSCTPSVRRTLVRRWAQKMCSASPKTELFQTFQIVTVLAKVSRKKGGCVAGRRVQRGGVYLQGREVLGSTFHGTGPPSCSAGS